MPTTLTRSRSPVMKRSRSEEANSMKLVASGTISALTIVPRFTATEFRTPTLLERLLFNIPCIGHCTGNAPEHKEACARTCWKHVPQLVSVQTKALKG